MTKRIFWCLLFALFIAGCTTNDSKNVSGVNSVIARDEPQKATIETIIDHSENVHEAKAMNVNEDRPIRRSILTRDSAIIFFYDNAEEILNTFDLWEDGPVHDMSFEIIDKSPGNEPLRVVIPNLNKQELRGKLPSELLMTLNENVVIGRVDIHAFYDSNFDRTGKYTPIIYEYYAMEDYEEENEIPGAMGTIVVLDNKGQIWFQRSIPFLSGQDVAVSNDSKLLVYSTYSHDNVPGRIHVMNLEDDKILYSVSMGENMITYGAGLDSGNLISFTLFDLKNKNSEFYVINSVQGVMYRKAFEENIKKYIQLNLPDGMIFVDRNSGSRDTMYYNRDFEIIQL